ncbi:hypothetical protein IPZ58_27690 [Streptomyces roseoverticillatus]|uniref:hypothetical protein n=1 Tax=Streptomyces roseoverticillatus TaxID=66429 RepID=UPI001F349476|nr:hypothetical protein [Streptomyces roseoverticillatus]MCF3105348.1 hypothetical protein [Streptomyces roseoverticillatus]
MDPRGGDVQAQARYFSDRAVLEGAELTPRQKELARAVLEIVLLAGLPPYDIEAAADGEETGVGLTPVPGNSRALRVSWRPDPAAESHMGTVLVAHELWVEGSPLGVSPVVFGLSRPRR